MPKPSSFISGLQRSGSTLLVAILRPTARFHAAVTSSVDSLFTALYLPMGLSCKCETFGERPAASCVTDAIRDLVLRCSLPGGLVPRSIHSSSQLESLRQPAPCRL